MTEHQRLPDLVPENLTAAQRAVYDRIASGPRGEVVGPLRVWTNNPQMADLSQALGQYARYDSSLPPVLSETAILVTARIWSSGFEWAQHAPIALEVGVAEHIVTAIGLGHRPEITDAAQKAVFDFTVELHRDRKVSDAVYNRAYDLMGQEAVIDLVGICGYYTLISMTINAFKVPDGTGPTLPVLNFPAEQMFV